MKTMMRCTWKRITNFLGGDPLKGKDIFLQAYEQFC